MSDQDLKDKALGHIIDNLTKRFGQLPTEDEVLDFIMGDQKVRETIWNKHNKETN